MNILANSMDAKRKAGAADLCDVVRAGEDALDRFLRIGLRRTALFYAAPETHVEYLLCMALWNRKGAFVPADAKEPYTLFEAETIAGIRDINGTVTDRYVGFAGPLLGSVKRVLRFGVGLGISKGGC